ncbi:hypothetical protein N9L06_06025 [Mariniblastus sp.]|nr:hypothetical protein [Mariniblastus sp.]
MSDSETEPEADYDDELETEEHPVMSPPLLMRSFLTIASSSVACLLIYAIIGLVLAGLFFPSIWDALTGDQAVVDRDFPIPVSMLIPWIILHAICSVGIGWLTAKVAPFAPNKHVLILAIFLFIGWMQKVFESGPNRMGMNIAFTVVIPLAIAYGSRMYCDRQLDTDLTSEKVV